MIPFFSRRIRASVDISLHRFDAVHAFEGGVYGAVIALALFLAAYTVACVGFSALGVIRPGDFASPLATVGHTAFGTISLYILLRAFGASEVFLRVVEATNWVGFLWVSVISLAVSPLVFDFIDLELEEPYAALTDTVLPLVLLFFGLFISFYFVYLYFKIISEMSNIKFVYVFLITILIGVSLTAIFDVLRQS